MADPRTPQSQPAASLVWPAHPADPNATTSLTVDDLIAGGGAPALRTYLGGRLDLAEADEPGTAKAWTQFAVNHMVERVGDRADCGGVEVSTASLQMLLAYVAWLETRGAA